MSSGKFPTNFVTLFLRPTARSIYRKTMRSFDSSFRTALSIDVWDLGRSFLVVDVPRDNLIALTSSMHNMILPVISSYWYWRRSRHLHIVSIKDSRFAHQQVILKYSHEYLQWSSFPRSSPYDCNQWIDGCSATKFVH